MDVPVTTYARIGADRVAYQVMGDGPVDLLYVSSMGDCIDMRWDWPPYAAFLRKLASFARLIQFDRRGFGASDPVTLDAGTFWEIWADDALAVLDAVGSEGAAVLGAADAGVTAMLFAASRPERTHSLILFNVAARILRADDYALGVEETERDVATAFVEQVWGSEALVEVSTPDAARDPAFRRFSAKSCRLACSPRQAGAYARANSQTDVRDVLPSIRVPTLVLQRENSPSPWLTPAQGRHVAASIPGARFATVPGIDLSLFAAPNGEILAEIEEFLTGVRPDTSLDRALAAVLVTDIVGSTQQAAALGDRRWRQQLEAHDRISQTLVEQHRGRIVKTTGDGVLATFDGPGRAIACAIEVRAALHSIGIGIRAGLHTGEVELRGDDIGGIGVHLAARVMSRAAPGQLLVSAAVPMLVAGSGVAFTDQGEHELKGLPGRWRLYAVDV